MGRGRRGALTPRTRRGPGGLGITLAFSSFFGNPSLSLQWLPEWG
jgi:hypothetical protein